MSTNKPQSSVSELIEYITHLDERGMLDALTIQEIREKLDSVVSITRSKINDITKASSQTEWGRCNVTEDFFHHLTPEQWKIFTLYWENSHRVVSSVEIAEMFFGTENITREQLNIINRHSTSIQIIARHWNKTGDLNITNVMYQGKLTIGYQWEVHELDES